ncbi:1813_t:CDS:2, partial [Racocetra fulgida]
SHSAPEPSNPHIDNNKDQETENNQLDLDNNENDEISNPEDNDAEENDQQESDDNKEPPPPPVTTKEVYSAIQTVLRYEEQTNSESSLDLEELEFLRQITSSATYA